MGNTVALYEPALGEGARTRSNRYTCTEEVTNTTPRGGPCTVADTGVGIVKIISFIEPPPTPREPSTFWEVLEEWGHMWMWEGMHLSGNGTGLWLEQAIWDKSLVAVTDGSYMKKLYPNMNSCAFIFECSRGGGRLTGAFSKQAIAACSYRGKLLGLLAIHLILLSVHKVSPDTIGLVHIYSNCLGALDKVKNLPPHRIPTRCHHSDVLKNIMVHCSSMSFDRIFSHVSAHQDDREAFNNLSRQAQLNCAVDFGAKRVLLNLSPVKLPRQQAFPLKTVSVWAGMEKLTSDIGSCIRYHAQKTLSREEFNAAGILTHVQFKRVDWATVHDALTSVPRMFQVWACKQVWGRLCPSCMQIPKTCGHILHCSHEGRVMAPQTTIMLLDQWMKRNNTDPDLRKCIYKYAMGQGGVLMEDICSGHGYKERYMTMAWSKDSIGWKRFMEGMICKEIRIIQSTHSNIAGFRCNMERWGQELITQLLEVTHGQWLYRNVQVCDKLMGMLAAQWKEELIMEIERQRELGTEGLLEEDCYLAECNLGDLEDTLGIKETYWLLANQAAWEAGRLKEIQNQTAVTGQNTT
jgi:hypothetical protein